MVGVRRRRKHVYKLTMPDIYTIEKIILEVFVVLILTNIVSAACSDVRYNEFVHREISAAGLPISGANCTAYTNNTEEYTNVTDEDGWVSFCYNASSYLTNTTCRKPSAYSAVVTNLSCPDAAYLDGRVSIHLKLINSLGEPLEAQDCYVRVFNERGFLTEDLGTNLLYSNQTFLDGNGNYIRTAGVPITSSVGSFDYGWIARSTGKDGVALYRPFQNYTIRAECNGKAENCTFQVVNREPVHVDDDVQYLMDNMQIIVLGIVVVVLGWFFLIPAFGKIFSGKGED